MVNSIKLKEMKPFNLFISGFGVVGKSPLVKAIYRSTKKLLKYHGHPTEVGLTEVKY